VICLLRHRHSSGKEHFLSGDILANQKRYGIQYTLFSMLKALHPFTSSTAFLVIRK